MSAPLSYKVALALGQRAHSNPEAWTVPSGLPEERGAAREAQIMTLVRKGYSVRRIAYLTGIPRSTIGDVITKSKQRIEPSPYSRLVPL